MYGEPLAGEQAKRAFDKLYQRVKGGRMPDLSDADGAIAMSTGMADHKQELSSMEYVAKQRLAHISTCKKTVYVRTLVQDIYIHAMRHSPLVFVSLAGSTGKAYLAVAYTAELLEHGMDERIILSRPL